MKLSLVTRSGRELLADGIDFQVIYILCYLVSEVDCFRLHFGRRAPLTYVVRPHFIKAKHPQSLQYDSPTTRTISNLKSNKKYHISSILSSDLVNDMLCRFVVWTIRKHVFSEAPGQDMKAVRA